MRIKNGTLWYMDDKMRLQVYFFKTISGKQPVRDWLKGLPHGDRKVIGDDLKTAQFGWPLGMPLIRKLEPNLWEVRSKLPNRIARVIFTVDEDKMVLLHGFIKKSQKTPTSDLKLAKQRLNKLRGSK